MGWHGFARMAEQEESKRHECIKDIYYYSEHENPYAEGQSIGVELIQAPSKNKYIGVCVTNQDDEFGYIYLSQEEARKMAENILKTLDDEHDI